jgi:predicted TIM-barrel fold metal-dependent hydrolase
MKPKYKKLRLIGKALDKDGKIIDVDKTVSWNSKAQYETLNDPKNWLPVLMTYPKLRLDLAHFSGCDWPKFMAGKQRNWVSDIIDMMARFENLYTDFSYTLWKPEYVKKLKQMILDNKLIRERVLYGTDHFMILNEGSFRSIVSNFKTTMGDDIMNQISRINARKFLNL